MSAAAIILTSGFLSPAEAQFPPIPDFNRFTPNLLQPSRDNQVTSGCIRLDGRCLFEVAASKSELQDRITDIEQRLNDITEIYFKNDTAQLKVRQQQEGNLPNIYISVGDRQVRLMSVTDRDAILTGANIEARAEDLVTQLQQDLERAKQERQPEVLARRGGIATGTGVMMLVASFAIYQ